MTVLLDQAKGVSATGYARLMGVQCPETRTSDLVEKRKGYYAKHFVEAWFANRLGGHLHGQQPNSYAFVMYAEEDDKYGRWLAHIECVKGHCVNDHLLASNNAVSYLGPTGLSIEERF